MRAPHVWRSVRRHVAEDTGAICAGAAGSATARAIVDYFHVARLAQRSHARSTIVGPIVDALSLTQRVAMLDTVARVLQSARRALAAPEPARTRPEPS
jgi:hypothetical protein